MSDLEKRLEEDSKYKPEEQEFDGVLGYNLPTPKDLTKYYTPSGVPNVERYEKAILNTEGEIPTNWTMNLTPDEIDELNSYHPDFIHHIGDVARQQEIIFDVENDVQQIALRRTKTREKINGLARNATGFGYVPKPGEIPEPFDFDAELKTSLDEVRQEKLDAVFGDFENKDKAMENAMNDKIPNNVQEGTLGKEWSKFKDKIGEQWRIGVYLGNQYFRPTEENIDRPENLEKYDHLNLVSQVALTGKFLSWVGTKLWGQEDANTFVGGQEERLIADVERARDLTIKEFTALSAGMTWEAGQQLQPELTNEILNMPFVQGDTSKAKAIFQVMSELNSPELVQANDLMKQAIADQSLDMIKKISSGEDTIGEAIVNGLGWYSKHFVGSISTGLFLLADEDGREMAAEFGLKEAIKKMDYRPSEVLGMSGTALGSMIDLSTNFALDPTVWFFTPRTGVRAGAIKQFAHAKYIKGWTSTGIGKGLADDLYKILKDGTKLQKREVLKHFGDKNQIRLKNTVKDDIARGNAEVTSERFYKIYTDSLLQGDNPYVFHKTAFNRLKAQRANYLISKSATSGKHRKALDKLMTAKNTSTKVNLAGPNPKRAITDAMESMVHATKLPEKEIQSLLNNLEDGLDDLYEATLAKGTNFSGDAIAAARVALINQSDLINYFEILLGASPRNFIKNLDDISTVSGQKLSNLAKDEITELVSKLPMPKFTPKNFKGTATKAKQRLKEMKKKGASEDEILKMENYISEIQNRKTTPYSLVQKKGEVLDLRQYDIDQLLSGPGRTMGFLAGPENKEFMIKMLDDMNELAGLAKGSKESIEKSAQFNKFLDDFTVNVDQILTGTLAGKGEDIVRQYVLKTHHKLMNKLDNLMRDYQIALNTSVRGSMQKLMTDTLDNMVVKLNWDKYERFQGGWYQLQKVDGQVYDQAKAVAKGAQKKDKAEVLKDFPDAVWVENPIQIKKNKKGEITSIDINWATLKIMMNYTDNVGAAGAILRGQQKVTGRGQGQKFTYNEAEEAFNVAGRKYDDQLIRDMKQEFKIKGDLSDEEVEAILVGNRDLLRTTNQVVEGELPISPFEFQLINAAVEGKNVTNAMRKLRAVKGYEMADMFNRAWAFEKIMRPSTAFVAAFDELAFYRSIYGWKGASKEYLFNRGVRKILKRIKKKGSLAKAMDDPKLAKEINEWVHDTMIKQQRLPIEIQQRYKMGFDKNAPVEMLTAKDAGFFNYAGQHIEGLLRDYGFQEYAVVIEKLRKLKPGKDLTQKQIDNMFVKGLDPDNDWLNFFQSSRADYIKGLKLFGYKQGGSPIETIYLGIKRKPVPHQHYLTNAEEAWKYYDSLKKWYTMGVGEKADEVWNSFLKAAAQRKKGIDINALPDVKHIGRIQVPGVKKPNGFLNQKGPQKLTNRMSRDTSLMEQMFGNPSWNRANLFANKAHATRAEQLRALYKSQGKEIIKAEDIGSGFGIATEAVDPKFQSDMWGMSYFDKQLFDAGKVTDNYINALAADYATSEIDNMMLKFHLATPIGRDMRFLAPFGGPWADFFGRYLKDLSRRSQLRGNWLAFTDEKTAGNFVKKRLADILNHVPNLRRMSYISRIANAELKGTVPNPLSAVGVGEDRIEVDFSPITFLPNGDNPMFAVNPIGGFIPIMLLGTAMNVLDDDAYFELEDTLEDLFPSASFFPPEEQWRNNGMGTLGRYLAGGGVMSQIVRSLDFVQEAFGMQEAPQSIGDVSMQLKYGRLENNSIHNDLNVILTWEENWETVGDFQEYVNDLARSARTSAAIDAGAQGIVRLGVPVNVKFTTRYTDVASNWIDFGKATGIYEDVVRPKTRALLDDNPYNEEVQVEALNDIRNWWFNLGDTTKGRAKQLTLMREYPQIIALTVPGYQVTELGERFLPQLEGKIYNEGQVFRTGTQDNQSNYDEYLASGLIQVRLPDQKIKHVIHENAAWSVNAVDIIYERMAEILNDPQVSRAEYIAESRGISAAEILTNAELREKYNIELTSSDIKNIEDISDKFKVNFTAESLGEDVVALIEELLYGTDYANPINGIYSARKIIPYLYAAHKSGKANPAYVFSSQDPDTQQFNKGMQILTGLTKATTFWEEDSDGKAELEFLTRFERKMYALNELWENNDGQIANNDEVQKIVADVYESFAIFNHIMGDINSFEGKNILSGEQWWNFYIKPKFKSLDLDWKQPVPSENDIEDKTFTVNLYDGDIDAKFQTIADSKPFKAVRIEASAKNVPDGDTINSMYSATDTEAIRVIGIQAYETSIDPTIYPEESQIAIQQKAFLQQFVDRYASQGRLFYVTDPRFGNDNRKDPYKRTLGWLFVENGINGDLPNGEGEYIFFSDHFSPADNYYTLNRDEPFDARKVERDEEDKSIMDLSFLEDIIEVDE